MVTVFAGGPSSVEPVTAWEALSGMFEPGADIVGARRAEDAGAAELLGCAPVHLDHWDEQYRHARYGYRGPAGAALLDAVAADVEDLIQRSGSATWLVPLGFSHPDHQLTAAASLDVAERHPEIDWLAYEELPYALYEAGRLEELVAHLEARGFRLEPTAHPDPPTRGPDKRRVLECYPSQLASLGSGARDALGAAERVHRLVRLIS